MTSHTAARLARSRATPRPGRRTLKYASRLVIRFGSTTWEYSAAKNAVLRSAAGSPWPGRVKRLIPGGAQRAADQRRRGHAEDCLRVGGGIRPGRAQDRARDRVDPVDGDPGRAQAGRRWQRRVEAIEIGPDLVGQVGSERGDQDPRASLTSRQHPRPVQQQRRSCPFRPRRTAGTAPSRNAGRTCAAPDGGRHARR